MAEQAQFNEPAVERLLQAVRQRHWLENHTFLPEQCGDYLCVAAWAVRHGEKEVRSGH